MSAGFTLRVPADPSFRELANEVVNRYVELAGIPDQARPGLAAAVEAAIDQLSGPAADAVELVCTTKPEGFDITVRAGGRSVVVHHPQTAARR